MMDRHDAGHDDDVDFTVRRMGPSNFGPFRRDVKHN